jgi:hypothetical protein
MRVPGFLRLEKGKEQALEFHSQAQYAPQEFENGMQQCFTELGFNWWNIHQFSEERWRLVRKVLVSKQARQDKENQIREILALSESLISPPRRQPTPVTDFQYSGDRIPLDFCLSRNHQQLLQSGQSDGNRDNAGYALSKDLIGVVDALQRLGINYEGDARQLFEDFALRCSPSLSDRDVDRIWRSASRGTPKAALPDEAIINRADFWQRKNNPGAFKGNEPDQSAYDEYVRQQEEHRRVAAAQEFRDLINCSIGKIKRFLKKAVFKGFGEKPTTPHRIAPKVLKIKPGEVPTHEEYEALGRPRLEFQGCDREAILAEAIGKGWKHILDNSGTGLGKSHAAGKAQPSDLGVEQLWYLAVDHRNPTTSTVEAEYTDLPVRNDGFKVDPNRKTPLGKSFQVWGGQEDKKETSGNCDRTGLFHTLSAKNLSVQESQTSPICQSCPHYIKMVEISDGNGKSTFRPKCSSKSGDGFGFRFEYSTALEAPKLRAHPSSAPKPKIDFTKNDDGDYIDPGYNYRQSGAFWDEAGTLVENQSVLEVRSKDLQEVYYKLPSLVSLRLLNEIRLDLDPLWEVLMGLLDPSFRGYMPDSGRFGMNNGDIRALLPEPPENLNEIIEFLNKELAPDLSFLQEQGSEIDFKSVRKEDRRSASRANLALNAQDSKHKAQALENVMLNWFVPFLEAWRDNSGYFKRDFGTTLKIYNRSNRHTNIAKACKWNIYLDATLSPQMLASMLDTEDILHIKQKTPSYKNLCVIQVTGMGRLSSDRRESADQRVNAVLTELDQRHPELAVIDWKSKATLGRGYHFRDGRGINRFKDAPALAIVGTPCPNIGALAIKFQLLKNKPAVEDSPEFQAFVDEHIQAEIAQELGRLRANLRPEEQLSAYVLSDYNLDFLKPELPDASFEQVEAFRISPDAGERYQRTKYKILQAVTKLIEAGADLKKITQQAVALASQGGVTRSRIGQIASDFGGWAKLRELLILLYRHSYNKTNNPVSASESALEADSNLAWMANQYLPLLAANPDDAPPEEVVRQVAQVMEAEGVNGFTEILKATNTTTKIGILACLESLFPEDLIPEEVAV